MEPQTKSFMENSGLEDSEIQERRHDSMLVSLLDKEMMMDVILSCYPDVKEGLGYWASDFIVSDPEAMHRTLEVPTWDIVNEKLTPEDICALFLAQHPLSSITHENVKHQISRLREEVAAFRSFERPAVNITAVHPIVHGSGEEKKIIGYVDFLVSLVYSGTTHFSPFKNTRNSSFNFFVEVRDKISSVGDVLRQMRTYMEFTKARPLLVAPAKKKVKEAIEAQGIPVFIWDF